MNARSWIHSQPVQAAIRTYALSLSLSLGPSLIPLLTAFLTAKSSKRANIQSLFRVLRREFGFDGFAFAMTLSVGGGAALRRLWDLRDATFRCRQSLLNFSTPQKTFVANAVSSTLGVLLLQAGRQRSHRLRRDKVPSLVALGSDSRTSHTLDLTLLLVVRAVDSLLQLAIQTITTTKVDDHISQAAPTLPKKAVASTAMLLTSRIDAFVFWICSSRIMWCFFYQPERLPKSYVKWIATLANLDGRVIQALKLLREGGWSYIKDSATQSALLTGFSQELGHSPSWGDPTLLPAYGGSVADATWKVLGVTNRRGVGGLPCELVHGSVGSSLGLEGSCAANSSIRGAMAFLEAIAIYLPVHFLPALLTRPRTLLEPHRVLFTLFGALRSATFLSAFVTLYWSSVCVTRSLVLAKLLPWISHDFWDGPFGCIFAGSLMCGSSIWIENGRRRGEMALYVLPRAVRACLPDSLVRNRSRSARYIERIAFILSFSTLITAATHRPETLRGLSRWTLSFIVNGTDGFSKRIRRGPGTTGAPIIAPTPEAQDSQQRFQAGGGK